MSDPKTMSEAVENMNRAFRDLGREIGKVVLPPLLRLNEALQPLAEWHRRRVLRRWLFAAVAVALVVAVVVAVLA